MSFLDSEATVIAEAYPNLGEEQKYTQKGIPKHVPGASISLLSAEAPNELTPYHQASTQSFIKL